VAASVTHSAALPNRFGGAAQIVNARAHQRARHARMLRIDDLARDAGAALGWGRPRGVSRGS
jgi:hypothetical protein